MRQPSNSGFTLIELTIVVVILGILAALAIPRFILTSATAKEREAELVLKHVYSMQLTHRTLQGGYATTILELRNVGFEGPSAMQYYTWAGDASIADGACLEATPAGSNHNSKSVDFATGVISDC